MHGNHPRRGSSPDGDARNRPSRNLTPHPQSRQRPPRVDGTTWWPWRGARTRSHPELGRENPQRPWYCVLRHGRVGRRQVFQSTRIPGTTRRGEPAAYPIDRHPGAGWSSPVARQAHNLKVRGSNPLPATNPTRSLDRDRFDRDRFGRRRRIMHYGPGRQIGANVRALLIPSIMLAVWAPPRVY